MKISVAVLCYNHEAFLPRALDSILMQKLKVPYEIVIGDDASTDRSQGILKTYQARHPDKIKLILKEENGGVYRNIMDVLARCEGEYVALLETDDYWNSPYKLARQIEFLDGHPDYTGCFHNTAIEWVSEANNHPNRYLRNFKTCAETHTYPAEFHPHHLLKGIFIPTSALVFRRRDYFEELRQLEGINRFLAWGMAFFFIKKNVGRGGKFKYINEVWSTYVKNEKSLTFTHKGSDFSATAIRILRILQKDSFYKYYQSEVYRGLCHQYELHYGNLRAEGDPKYKSTVFQFFKCSLLFTYYRTKQFLKQE